MADVDVTPKPDYGIRPPQVLPWKAKNADWFQRNIQFCIQRTNFNFGAQTNQRKDLRVFYDVYNNQFPLEWFSHITDPLSAKNPKHKSFPAKIRPVTILRQNIDLLCAEYPRRPFIWSIQNLGEDGYSTMLDQLNQKVQGNLKQHFVQGALQQAQANGQQLNPQQQQQLAQQVQLPQQVQEEFQASYKDALCVKAQHWLKRTLQDTDFHQKALLMFKDWLIAGQCYSYKGVHNNELDYRRISPLNIDFDKSEDQQMVEDGEWVVGRYLWTLSDVVDQFYHDLSEKDQNHLETEYWYNSPMGYYENLKGVFTDPQERNKIPVYHVQWKGRKKVGFLSYLDPETFQYVEEVVDEDYIVDRSKGEQVEWRWTNELYEGWRIGRDTFKNMRAALVPRTEMNNASHCKLNYNGRKYSDTHSENISVLEIGIPFQIMYIIITYILEKTIAKNKGKIALFDLNAIPRAGGWTEEAFFYYIEGMGYGLLDRNQTGVDKQFVYQVLDLSLFDQIKQLIELQNYFKQQWDDITGISRQRKGETYSSDGEGVNERAVFQSTVMTDMIFIRFEEFIQKELQGIIDFIPFLTAKGERSTYNDDDYGTMLMEIFPEDFSMAQLGIYVASSSIEAENLKQAKAIVESYVQREGKLSTAMEIIQADNMAIITEKLKELEAIEQQQAQAEQKSEQDAALAQEELRQKYAAYIEILKRQTMEAEYDRKEDIEYIRGEFLVEANDKGDKHADNLDAEKLLAQREKTQQEFAARKEDQNIKRQELNQKQQQMEHDMNMDKLHHTQVEVPKAKAAVKKANQKPKSSS
jgi:hypothetical protein